MPPRQTSPYGIALKPQRGASGPPATSSRSNSANPPGTLSSLPPGAILLAQAGGIQQPAKHQGPRAVWMRALLFQPSHLTLSAVQQKYIPEFMKSRLGAVNPFKVVFQKQPSQAQIRQMPNTDFAVYLLTRFGASEIMSIAKQYLPNGNPKSYQNAVKSFALSQSGEEGLNLRQGQRNVSFVRVANFLIHLRFSPSKELELKVARKIAHTACHELGHAMNASHPDGSIMASPISTNLDDKLPHFTKPSIRKMRTDLVARIQNNP